MVNALNIQVCHHNNRIRGLSEAGRREANAKAEASVEAVEEASAVLSTATIKLHTLFIIRKFIVVEK